MITALHWSLVAAAFLLGVGVGLFAYGALWRAQRVEWIRENSKKIVAEQWHTIRAQAFESLAEALYEQWRKSLPDGPDDRGDFKRGFRSALISAVGVAESLAVENRRRAASAADGEGVGHGG